jgi:hypothetical protein
MRGGLRHGEDMGDKYTYCVAFFDITYVNCGFATFLIFTLPAGALADMVDERSCLF